MDSHDKQLYAPHTIVRTKPTQALIRWLVKIIDLFCTPWTFQKQIWLADYPYQFLLFFLGEPICLLDMFSFFDKITGIGALTRHTNFSTQNRL